ncbi:MAG: putative riboflavin transport system substrate-binding protein, partial [Chloroflexota bacterium]|nr:putative riboflavin transport system substrate-binding protein [Chloroflexota bacterium]
MPIRRSRSLIARLVLAVATPALLGACATPATPAASASTAASASNRPASSGVPAPSVRAVTLTVGLGYIPSVQFAAFYRADQAGYYAAEGLEVTFQNEIDANLVPKIGAGTVDLGLSDGTSVIPAVSQGIPIRYVATIYGQFPSIVFAKASSGITDANELVGRKLGIPGKYGSSWIMLQALLASKNHTVDDLTIVEYPDFGQGAAVTQGAVDAATGFVNNEPVQLERTGEKATVLHIDDVTPLPGPGIVVGTGTLASKHDAVAGFVRATLKAMNEIAADPTVGVDAAVTAVPELGKDKDLQRALLEATIASWRPAGA